MKLFPMRLSPLLRLFLRSHHFCPDTGRSRCGCVWYSLHSHSLGLPGVEWGFGSFYIPRSLHGRTGRPYFTARQRLAEYSLGFLLVSFSALSSGDYAAVDGKVLAHGLSRSSRPNQSMNSIAPLPCNLRMVATTPCSELSLSR